MPTAGATTPAPPIKVTSYLDKLVNIVPGTDSTVVKVTIITSDPTQSGGGCPRGVMFKAMDCGIVVREFVLQSRYCVHFRANTLGKGMNLLILPAMG